MEKFRRYFEAFSGATEWSEVQPAFNDVFHPDLRVVRRLALIETGLLVAALVTFFIGIGGAIQFGMPPMAILAVTLFTVSAVVGLGLIPAAVITWVKQWLTVGERVVLSTLGLTTPILLWWTIYWNVFGYRF